jgi:hypothetical protein
MEWHGVNIASMTNDDNMMCGDNNEGGSNQAHPLLRVWGYKRENDITKRDITEVKMYVA